MSTVTYRSAYATASPIVTAGIACTESLMQLSLTQGSVSAFERIAAPKRKLDAPPSSP